MKYLFLLFLLSLIVPLTTQAQMLSSDNGIRSPQSIQVAQSDIGEPADPDFDSAPMDAPITDRVNLPVVPTQPINPFTPAPEPITRQNTKQVLKKMPRITAQRSIADERIDDAYVQELIKNNFNFTNAIE